MHENSFLSFEEARIKKNKNGQMFKYFYFYVDPENYVEEFEY